MTPEELAVFEDVFRSVDPNLERRAKTRYRLCFPREIRDEDIVSHIQAVIIVSCIEFDPPKCNSIDAFINQNLKFSYRYLMRRNKFKRCSKCKGKRPAKFLCSKCNFCGWIDGCPHRETSLTDGLILSQRPDATSDDEQIRSLKPQLAGIGAIDHTGDFKFDPKWLKQQTPKVQRLVQRLQKMSVERRRWLMSELGYGPPAPLPQIESGEGLTEEEKENRKRALALRRKHKKRDPELWNELKRQLAQKT